MGMILNVYIYFYFNRKGRKVRKGKTFLESFSFCYGDVLSIGIFGINADILINFFFHLRLSALNYPCILSTQFKHNSRKCSPLTSKLGY
jgi:hypothetical protein